MPAAEAARSGHNGVERSFLDALERIRAGAPKDPELAKRAKRGTLKISIAVVAREAGRSRTHISHAGCAYPAIRQTILELKAPQKSTPTSIAEINRRLREENAELRRTVKHARDSMAAMALRMARVVREAERRVAIAERKKRGSASPDHVAGQFADERAAPADGKVVNMRDR